VNIESVMDADINPETQVLLTATATKHRATLEAIAALKPVPDLRHEKFLNQRKHHNFTLSSTRGSEHICHIVLSIRKTQDTWCRNIATTFSFHLISTKHIVLSAKIKLIPYLQQHIVTKVVPVPVHLLIW
jgi:hypothetical protein